MSRRILHSLQGICNQKRGVSPHVLQEVLTLAIEIAREGREGTPIGALFVIGDEERVLAKTQPLILDPLWFHPESRKRIEDPDLRETVKELAQLDGAFLVSANGVVISACRYINASSTGVRLTLGFGSRHMAAASITHETKAVAVVVSRSQVVRVFDNGHLVGEIFPEQQYGRKSARRKGRIGTHEGEPFRVVTAE